MLLHVPLHTFLFQEANRPRLGSPSQPAAGDLIGVLLSLPLLLKFARLLCASVLCGRQRRVCGRYQLRCTGPLSQGPGTAGVRSAHTPPGSATRPGPLPMARLSPELDSVTRKVQAFEEATSNTEGSRP